MAIGKIISSILGLEDASVGPGQQTTQNATLPTAQNTATSNTITTTSTNLASPRTVVSVTRSSPNSLGGQYATAAYDDGTTENFGQFTFVFPQVGWIEQLDAFGSRIGWMDTYGTFHPDNNMGWPPPYQPQISIPSVWTPTIQIPLPKEKCSKCGELKNYEEIQERWNWGSLAETQRSICKKCYCVQKDKEYGLNRNIENEEILYGKRNKPTEE